METRIGAGKRLGAFLLDILFILLLCIGTAIVVLSTGIYMIGADKILDTSTEIGRNVEDLTNKIERNISPTLNAEESLIFVLKTRNDLDKYIITHLSDVINGLSDRNLDDMVDIVFNNLVEVQDNNFENQKANEIRQDIKTLIYDTNLGYVLGDVIRLILIVIGVVATFAFFYFILEGLIGASIAKLILGIRIAKANAEKGNLLYFMWRFIIKYSGVILVIIGFILDMDILMKIGLALIVVILIGSLTILSESRRALHDYISGTAVYSRYDLERIDN